MSKRWLLLAGLVLASAWGVTGIQAAHSDEPTSAAFSSPADEADETGRQVAAPEEILALNPTNPDESANTAGGDDGPEPPSSAVIDRITWVGSVSGTFEELCQPCHVWASSYAEVTRRVQNGQMDAYLDIEHFIAGADKEAVQSWIVGGYPER